MFWRPRSITQLVMIGLLTVLAPLCVAIFYTIQTFDELSAENSRVSQTVVGLTRTTQTLQSGMFELERRARQFLTLEDVGLLQLFQREKEELAAQLSELQRTISKGAADDPALQEQHSTLVELLARVPTDAAGLSDQLPLFQELSIQSQRLTRLGQVYVDERLEQHRINAGEIKQSLMVMVSLLAGLTVTFSFLFIYWVNKPIKQIETEIKQMGDGDLGHEIQISGPREMQTLGRQLEWLRSRLNKLETEKQQFLRHMSHELKTPLASLREGADLMAEGVVGELERRQQEIVDIIQLNSRELQRLIENLLDYNQLRHDLELQVERVNLFSLWQELHRINDISIRNKQLDVRVDGAVESWCVDPAKLRTIVDNLLSNAVNYTPVKGQITVAWYVEVGVLVVDVANTGVPIPHAEGQKIFQPFYQGSSVRSGPIKGSGIGLSVARECAHALGGTLDLVSHPDFPVCFRLQCPALKQEAA